MVNKLAIEQQGAVAAASLPPKDHNRPPSPLELMTADFIEVYEKQLAEVEPVAERANTAPEKIESDEDLALWSKIVVDARTVSKTLDTARLNEQRPILAMFKEVFGGKVERCDRIVQAGTDKANAYNRAKLAREKAAREADEKRLREEAEKKRAEAQEAMEWQQPGEALDAIQEAAKIETAAAQVAAAAPKTADTTRVQGDGAQSSAQTVWKFEIADYSKVDLNAIRAFLAPEAIEKAVRAIVKIQKGATKIEGVRVFEDASTRFRG